jgi:hypothetical protein
MSGGVSGSSVHKNARYIFGLLMWGASSATVPFHSK